jgi:RNA polymerase sigma-70 factor (ECF subfamily)
MTGCNDDNSLIEACRAGRTEAFGVLVQRYQDRLYPTMLRLTGSADDALDLLQDAFLRAFEKLDRFQGDSSFYTWVYRIAVNLALSGRRRRRVSVRLGVGGGGGRGEGLDPPDDPIQSDPTLPLERAERDDLIQSALNSLADDHRAVVVMKEFDGLRYEEIAATLGVPVGTVRSRLHRARLDLRERLKGVVAERHPARTAARPVP